MNRKESIEIAERELVSKRIIRDESFDRGDYDAPIEVEAYTEGFNEMRDKAMPILADKITRIKTLEVKCEDLSDMICARDSYIEELQQKLAESKKAIKWCDDESCGKNVEIKELLKITEEQNDTIILVDGKNKELKQKLDRVEKE